MPYAINYAILHSLQQHIFDHWHGERYDNDGNLSQSGYVETPLESMLQYEDRNGVTRVFGPSIVTIGRYLSDPLRLAGLSEIPSGRVELHANDSEAPEDWGHTLVTSGDDAGYNSVPMTSSLYAHELGGHTMHWRRFTVEYEIYLVDSDQQREEAYRLGLAAEKYLESLVNSSAPNRVVWSWPMTDSDGNTVTDPFGESVLLSQVVKTYGELRGGPQSSNRGDYIWGGKIYFQVQTAS